MITRHLETLAFRHVAPRGVRYVTPVRPGDASGLVAEVYRQMERDFQLAPPITIHSPCPDLLAGVWTASRECLIAGPADRVARELVAATVSRTNACPYCVDVHGMMLDGAGRQDLAKAVALGTDAVTVDRDSGRLVEWAAATRSPGSMCLASPPMTEVDRPQMFGTAVVFHYINRMVNVFLEASPMPARLPEIVKHAFGSAMTSRIVSVVATPAESFRFLPAGVLPPEFHWARSNPAVEGALSRMTSVVDRAGEAALPATVRELLQGWLAQWRGEDMSLSRAWVELAVEGLKAQERPVARLALLAALASHQVDDGVMQACRSEGMTDADLIATASWAAFGAARQIASWLSPLLEAAARRPLS